MIDGSLWVGGLPDKPNDDLLRQVVSLYGLGEPEFTRLSTTPLGARKRKKGWGVVKFKTDEEAANVLVKSWETLVSTSALPWPVHVEAWAPGEDFVDKFLLEAGRNRIAAPSHFVMTNTLEWELCLEWRLLAMQHRAQKEALRHQHFEARHALMERKFGEDRAKWSEAKQDSTPPTTRIRKALYVMGINAHATKDDVSTYFQKYGSVQNVTLILETQKGSRNAKVVFTEVHAARNARKELQNQKDTPIGNVVVRPFLESASLWMCDIGVETTNKDLQESFEQFGDVKEATIALNDHTRRLMSYGMVQLAHHSVASAVLDALDFEVFVLSGSSRPVHAEPFLKNLKHWHEQSPASSLMKEERLREITASDHVFDVFKAARDLQVGQRCEVKQLKHLQLQERKRKEEVHKTRLQTEYSKMGKLKDMCDRLLSRVASQPQQSQASRKRVHNEAHGANNNSTREPKAAKNTTHQAQSHAPATTKPDRNMHVCVSVCVCVYVS